MIKSNPYTNSKYVEDKLRIYPTNYKELDSFSGTLWTLMFVFGKQMWEGLSTSFQNNIINII